MNMKYGFIGSSISTFLISIFDKVEPAVIVFMTVLAVLAIIEAIEKSNRGETK